MSIKLIVGLGNPGDAYALTRHNAGAWFVKALAEQSGNPPFKADKKLHGAIASLERDNHACRLLLPLTYMNQSGLSVRAAAQFYRINPDEILVAHDELDLPVGRIKLKTDGGHGGHNGLRDIIQHLGSSAFHRLRVGIGHPGHRDLVHQYVLNKPSKSDHALIDEAIDRAVLTMPTALSGQLAIAMSQLNG